MFRTLKALVTLPVLWWRIPGHIHRDPPIQPPHVYPAPPTDARVVITHEQKTTIDVRV